MNRDALLALLRDIQAGACTPAQAIRAVERESFQELGFARLDHQRATRTGFPEVVLAQGKTAHQLRRICQEHLRVHARLLVTRLTPEVYETVARDLPPGHYNAAARTLSFGLETVTGAGCVLVLCAGTADLPVAEEALETARLMGSRVELVADVGVAGLHRLLDVEPRLHAARVLVVVAGMEGALPSVVGGLVRVPVIAVPTSVGYGASFGGVAALLAMLNSCAPGVSVVNIDNGFGAGYVAALINRGAEQAAAGAGAGVASSS
ncbi:MAG: nickel pincer cofactor biosynthesis protein LarB [Candidatus Lambdaproteobacteria bacterium]|nr:nickel pincer cofactor biosynthesis protein LarB [Candidatus Lambdaproteobacteria bacterium]